MMMMIDFVRKKRQNQINNFCLLLFLFTVHKNPTRIVYNDVYQRLKKNHIFCIYKEKLKLRMTFQKKSSLMYKVHFVYVA